jgi:DNA-binding SARP family transcriptional activator/tetratricopeptide (TPR) repeat protein
VDLRLLGPIEATLDGRVVPVRRRLERRLLGVLAVRPGHYHSVERLIDLLWPVSPPARARASLQAMVSHLRADLRLAGPEEPVLVTLRGGYTLRIDAADVDVHRFRELLREARERPLERAGLLADAVAMWRGPAMADVFDDSERARYFPELDEAWPAAREELAATRPAAEELVGELRDLCAEYPLRERPVELLIAALAELGRSGEALTVYAALAERLAAELGTPPGERLSRLREEIQSAGAARAPRPGAVPAQLPSPPVAFVGRGRELGELDRLLAGGAPPVLVISAVVGTAGVGKTATTLRWAHRVRDQFPDGQLFLDLRGYSPGRPMRPAQALASLLHALGVPAAGVPADPEQAAGLYRTVLAGRRLLIVLDNAGDADQVRPLLPGTSGSLVIVTSRDRLSGLVARDSAHRITLDLLAEAESVRLLTMLLDADRVAADPVAVADLARACGHLPLALRIAAALVLDEPGTEVAEHVRRLLEGRVQALAISDDPAAAVQAAFDMSYARLPDDARRLFRLLGSVPSATLPVAALPELADRPQTIATRALDRLAAAHLAEVIGDRVAVHDLLREYAGRLGVPAETTAARRRLFRWYLVRAQEAVDLMAPSRVRLPVAPESEAAGWFADADAAVAWLEREEPAMVALVRSSVEAPAALLADQLRSYFWVTRNSLNWFATARAGLLAADAVGDPELRGASHLSLGNAYHMTGDHLAAIAHLRRAGALLHRAGHPEYQAAAAGSLGAVYGDLGRPATAAACFEGALRLNRRIGRAQGIAVMLSNLAIVYAMGGQFRLAAERCAAALEIFRELGARPNEAVVLTNLGQVWTHLGDYQGGLQALDAAIGIAGELGMASIEANARAAVGVIHVRTGRVADAQGALAAALDMAESSGDHHCVATVRMALGALHLLRGRRGEAKASYARAADWARTAQLPVTEAEALAGIALAVSADDARLARSSAERAVTLARQAGAAAMAAEATAALAEALRRQGDLAASARAATAALVAAGELSMPLLTVRALITLGHVDGSRASWVRAEPAARELGAPEAEVIAALLSGR